MNSTTTVDTSTPIPSHITKEQVLAFLHNTDKMIALNPLISEGNPLPADRVLSFYETVDKKNKAANASFCKLYHVYEDSDARQASSGAWTKKFVPDKVVYESAYESTPTRMITVTQAPLNVNSITTWFIKENADGLVVEMTGKVTSDAVLMQFIKKMLPEDHKTLAVSFMEALKKDVGEAA